MVDLLLTDVIMLSDIIMWILVACYKNDIMAEVLLLNISIIRRSCVQALFAAVTADLGNLATGSKSLGSRYLGDLQTV